MLRLPSGEDEVPQLVVSGYETEEPEADSESAFEELDGSARVKKRRRSSRTRDEGFDETFARKKEVGPKLVKCVIGSVAMIGGILTLALLWPRGEKPESGGSAATEPKGAKPEEVEEEQLVIEAKREVVRPILVENELVPVYREFLNADSPEEMARWVRHPEITLPRIRKFYGENFSSVGFSKVVWGDHPLRVGEAIKVVLQVRNYEKRTIFAVDEDGWKIDWESWVGWSEMGWSEVKELQPTKPVLFRAVVSDVSYYNFGFADEAQWSSYRLEPMNDEISVFGYVPRGGELDSRLKSLEGIENRLFLLKFRYPDEATADNQVIIDEILAEGWFVSEDPS